MSFLYHFSLLRKNRVKKIAQNCTPPLTNMSELDNQFAALWEKGKYGALYELSHTHRVKEEVETKVFDNDCHRCKMMSFMQVEVRAFAVMKYEELISTGQNPNEYAINIWTDGEDVRGDDIPLMDFIHNPRRVLDFRNSLVKKA